MLRTSVKYVSAIILIAVLLIIWFCLCVPENCMLCDQISYHAPCVVNLSTGEVLELVVYDPHLIDAGKITEEDGGFFSFLRGAGLIGYRDTANWVAQVTIPEKTDRMKRSLFCVDCRRQLKGSAGEGFILADLYVPGSPILFTIQDGAEYKMRYYLISMSGSEELTITVNGQMQNQ